jgi:hypothetical protein
VYVVKQQYHRKYYSISFYWNAILCCQIISPIKHNKKDYNNRALFGLTDFDIFLWVGHLLLYFSAS